MTSRYTVYAYYNPPHMQTMEEHVELALQVFSEEDPLVRFGTTLTPAFYVLLKLGLLMHDFGKVLFKPSRREGLSFTGHEVVSGWMTYRLLEGFETSGKILRKLGLSGGQSQRGALVLAVLLHHHPMSYTYRLEKLQRQKRKLTRDHVKAFAESVAKPAAKHLSLSGAELEELLLEALGSSEVESAEICSAVESIYGNLLKNVWLLGTPTSRRLFLLLLQGLVAADYRASQTRGSSTPRSRFARAVEVFLEHYSHR